MLALFRRAVVPRFAVLLAKPLQAPESPPGVCEFMGPWTLYIYMTDVLRCKNFTTCAAVYL